MFGSSLHSFSLPVYPSLPVRVSLCEALAMTAWNTRGGCCNIRVATYDITSLVFLLSAGTTPAAGSFPASFPSIPFSPQAYYHPLPQLPQACSRSLRACSRLRSSRCIAMSNRRHCSTVLSCISVFPLRFLDSAVSRMLASMSSFASKV
jgi:hypothetical protein